MTDDVEEIRGSMAFHKRRIKAIRSEINGLELRVRNYKSLINRGGGGYDIAALEASNEHAGQQIDRMQQEISAATTQIAGCRQQIDFVERRDRIAKGIEIVAETE